MTPAYKLEVRRTGWPITRWSWDVSRSLTNGGPFLMEVAGGLAVSLNSAKRQMRRAVRRSERTRAAHEISAAVVLPGVES